MAVDIEIGTVTGRSIVQNRDSDRPVRMLQVVLSGDDDVQDVEYFDSAGNDSSPIDGSEVVVFSIGEAYKIAIGVDDTVLKSASPGQREIYSSVAGAKMARIFLDELGNVVVTKGPTGTITLGGDDAGVAGLGNETKVDAITDSVTITWIALVTAAINILAPGSILPNQIPIELVGKISTASTTVKRAP